MIQIDGSTQTLVFTPDGVFDAGCVGLYRQQILDAMNNGLRRVIFDLQSTRLISSSALGLMIEVWKIASARGFFFEVKSASDSIQELFAHTRLDRLFSAEKETSESDQVRAFSMVNESLSAEILMLDRFNRAQLSILNLNRPEEIPGAVLKEILDALSGRRGAFFQWDDPANALELEASVGLSESAENLSMEIEDGSLERIVMERGHGTCIQAGSKDYGLSAIAARLHLGTFVLAPMKITDGPEGLFIIESPPDMNFFCSLAPLISAFVSMGALAYEKVRLMGQLEERNARLEQAMATLGRKQSALNDSSKLAVLGALVSGLRHSFNNRLVPILGYSQLLGKRFASDEKACRQLEILESSAKDLKKMLDRLTLITRSRAPMFLETDINETLESALTLALPLLGERNIRVERRIVAPLPRLHIDRDLMIQAFLSIFHRLQFAFDPSAPERVLHIHLDGGVDPDSLLIDFVAQDAGISNDLLESIQDPLTPMQRIGDEDVFNLSIPASVVRKHGGTFEVDSSPEEGLCVRLVFPLKLRRLDTLPIIL